MSTANLPTESPRPGPVVHYPDGDGKPMAETGIHVLLMLNLIGSLRAFFHRRTDVYVIGNMFLYYEEGNPAARRSPDVMVVKGVDGTYQRRSFKTWVERAVPSVIFELTSQETADEDRGPKHELYERLGVREYFLFDPLHEYLEQPLIGYRLIGGRYEPLPPANDGGVLSAELGLRLVPDGENLALIDFRTGKRLVAPIETYQKLDEAYLRLKQTEQKLEQEVQRIQEAEEQAERERKNAAQAKEQAERERQQAALAKEQAERERRNAAQAQEQAERERQRREQLEAELARLRAQLAPPPDEPGPA
jgi:Uma2 family endonuclease